MTCKDCLHHKSCFNMAFRCGYKAEALDGAEICEDFKNKADFVEVVRCKDCKYWKNKNGGYREASNTLSFVNNENKDFCSYGKRGD